MRVSCGHQLPLVTRRRAVVGVPEIVRGSRSPRRYSLDRRPLRALRGDGTVELVVHLHHRGEITRRDALDLFDGDTGVVEIPLAQKRRGVGKPPFTRHDTFVHTDTSRSPTGSRLNIV